jgi:hypothetical protein
MTPSRTLTILIFSLSSGFSPLGAQIQTGPVPDKVVDALLIQSRDKRSGKKAWQYEDKFLNAVDPILTEAMTTCTAKTPDTVWPGSIAFVIAKDGRVKRIMWSADIPMGKRVGEKLDHQVTATSRRQLGRRSGRRKPQPGAEKRPSRYSTQTDLGADGRL